MHSPEISSTLSRLAEQLFALGQRQSDLHAITARTDERTAAIVRTLEALAARGTALEQTFNTRLTSARNRSEALDTRVTTVEIRASQAEREREQLSGRVSKLEEHQPLYEKPTWVRVAELAPPVLLLIVVAIAKWHGIDPAWLGIK